MPLANHSDDDGVELDVAELAAAYVAAWIRRTAKAYAESSEDKSPHVLELRITDLGWEDDGTVAFTVDAEERSTKSLGGVVTGIKVPPRKR